MESPLFASSDSATPFLSSDPRSNAETGEESEFSRLIALSNPLAALAEEEYHYFHNNPTPASSWGDSPLFDNLDYADAHRQSPPCPSVYRRRPSSTILAAFFCLVHVCAVWGAYTASSWSETHLRISVAWQEKYLPQLDNVVADRIVQTSALATVFEWLGGTGHYGFLMLLWATALLLPCAAMIISPTFVLSDHRRILDWDQRMRKLNTRRAVELTLRWALLAVFADRMVDLAVSPLLQLEWTDTVIRVQNRALGPFAAFCLGSVSAVIGGAVVLRWPPAAGDATNAPITPSRRFTPAVDDKDVHGGATRNGNQLSRQNSNDADTMDDAPPMMVLEEAAELLEPSTEDPTNPEHNGDAVGNDDEPSAVVAPSGPSRPKGITYLQRVLVFQMGVLSLILWLPSMYLPILEVSYRGAAVDFLQTSRLSAFLWDIPVTLAHDHSGTAPWIQYVLGLVHVIGLIGIPLICSCLCVLAWLGDPFWAIPSKRYLFALQPGMCGIVFVVALWGTQHALYPSLTFHEHICRLIQVMPNEPCLAPQGKLLPGAWFYSLHAIVMEVYVVCTLKWA